MQSGILVSQFCPVYNPCGQSQEYVPPPRSLQVAPFWHGRVSHGFCSIVSHKGKAYPSGQEHTNTPNKWLVQFPPFWQGLGSQSLMSSEQSNPVNPTTHEHVYVELSSTQALAPKSSHGPKRDVSTAQ